MPLAVLAHVVRRAIRRVPPLAGDPYLLIAECHPPRFVGRGIVERPERPEPVLREIVAERHSVRRPRSAERLDDRVREIAAAEARPAVVAPRSEEHTSELQSLMRISYAVFCLKNTKDHESIKHLLIHRPYRKTCPTLSLQI